MKACLTCREPTTARGVKTVVGVSTSAMLEKTRLFRHLEKNAVVVEFGNECSTMEWSFTCRGAMSLSNRPGVTGRQRCGHESGHERE